MCLGPKCPCIYPKVKHIQLPYVSFRERSPIDRVSIKNQLNTLSESLITKLRYTIRPGMCLQYSIFAFAALLGQEIFAWERVQPLFQNFERLKLRIENLEVDKLSEIQINQAKNWLREFDNINDQKSTQVFANVVRDILNKLELTQQKEQEQLMIHLSKVNVQEEKTNNSDSQHSEQTSELKIKQEESPTRKFNFSQILDSSARKQIYKTFRNSDKSYSASNCKQFQQEQEYEFEQEDSLDKQQTFEFTNSQFDDVINLKKELSIINKDIHFLQMQAKQKAFLSDRSRITNYFKKEQKNDKQYLIMRTQESQENEEYTNRQKRKERELQRDSFSFRKEMNSKKSQRNMGFERYLEKYTSKYIDRLDKIDQEEQELQQIRSELKKAKEMKQKLLKVQKN